MSSGKRKVLRVAAVSSRHPPGALEANLASHAAWTERAVASGARFVGFPECSITGYLPDPGVAVSARGPEVAFITSLARRHHVYIAAGFVERSGRRFFNTQVLAGPRGAIGLMRKTHPIKTERRFFTAGHDFPIFRVGPAHMGIAICSDGTHYETVHALALRGADVIVAPHATYLQHTPGSWLAWRLSRWPLFAGDCCVFLVGCNNAGRSEGPQPDEENLGFASGALVVGPSGETVARSRIRINRETMVVADLCLTGIRARRRDLFSFRDARTDLFYRGLV